ncbi:MAG: hypothetical protein COA78_34900 [Blastopirellula sp.]|nr:MAG: hypothetical protein COA78_34900 [Blastopirellula sp.]
MVCSLTLLIAPPANAQKRGSSSISSKLTQLVNQRSNIRVLSAFIEVVDTPSKSTVEILRDNKRQAIGTIVDADGLILTKASQVNLVMLKGELAPLVCKLANNDRHEAKIVSINKEYDLALLKIDVKRLDPIRFTLQEDPMVGAVLASTALGDKPLGIGVMSAASRTIKQSRPMIGVQLKDIVDGARVESIVSGSAAKKAKLKIGDVIVKIDMKQIKDTQTLISTIKEYQPGDIIRLLVKRGEEQLELLCTLGEYSSGPNQARHEFQNHLGGKLSSRRSGFPMVFQHDTFLNPEDCGGPLVDLDGNAVGINIARAGRVASYAIPAKVLPELIAKLMLDAESSEVSTSSE